MEEGDSESIGDELSSSSSQHTNSLDEDTPDAETVETTEEYLIDIREIRQRHKSQTYKITLGSFKSTLRRQLERVQRKRFDSDSTSADETTLAWLERLRGGRNVFLRIEGQSGGVWSKAEGQCERSARQLRGRDEHLAITAKDDIRYGVTNREIVDFSRSSKQQSTQTRRLDNECNYAYERQNQVSSTPREVFQGYLDSSDLLTREDAEEFSSLIEKAVGPTERAGTSRNHTAHHRVEEPDSADESDAGAKQMSLQKCTKRREVNKAVRQKDRNKTLHVLQWNEKTESETAIREETVELLEKKEVIGATNKKKNREISKKGCKSLALGEPRRLRQSEKITPSIGFPTNVAGDDGGWDDDKKRVVAHIPHLQERDAPSSSSASSDKNIDSTGIVTTSVTTDAGPDDHDTAYSNMRTGESSGWLESQKTESSLVEPVKMFGKLGGGKRRIPKRVTRRPPLPKKVLTSSESEADGNTSLDNILRKFGMDGSSDNTPNDVHSKKDASYKSQSVRMTKRVRKRSRDVPEQLGDPNEDSQNLAPDIPHPKRVKRSAPSDLISEETVETVVHKRTSRGKYSSKSFVRKCLRKKRQRRRFSSGDEKTTKQGKLSVHQPHQKNDSSSSLRSEPDRDRVKTDNERVPLDSENQQSAHDEISDRTTRSHPKKALNEENTIPLVSEKRQSVDDEVSDTSTRSHPKKALNEEDTITLVSENRQSVDKEASDTSTRSHPKKALNEENTITLVSEKRQSVDNEISDTTTRSYPKKALNEENTITLVSEKRQSVDDKISDTTTHSHPKKVLNEKKAITQITTPAVLSLQRKSQKLVRTTYKIMFYLFLLVCAIVFISFVARSFLFCKITSRCSRCDVEYAVERFINIHSNIRHLKQPPI